MQISMYCTFVSHVLTAVIYVGSGFIEAENYREKHVYVLLTQIMLQYGMSNVLCSDNVPVGGYEGLLHGKEIKERPGYSSSVQVD